MKIVVVAGGLSPERDVSLTSGSLVANALIDSGYEVCLMDLYFGTETGDFDSLFIDTNSEKRYLYTVPDTEPDLETIKKQSNNGDVLIGKNVIEVCQEADLVFLALHGDIGENGKLQAVFDSFGVSYTGTGYAGSLIAMDKDLSKQIMIQNNILTPSWQLVNVNDGVDNIVSKIQYPCVIKPCSCGSSVGVSIVKNDAQFVAAIECAKVYEDMFLVEQMIKGREFSVGVLDGAALPIIEIVPLTGFYDYKNKYQSGFTKEICPAELDSDISKQMQDIALMVHSALRLEVYSRVDFILDNDNNIFCLEANTLPGMTPTSLLPQEAKAMGISYNELCDKIVKLSLDK